MSTSRNWIDTGYIKLPYQYILQLDVLHQLAMGGFLGVICFVARTLVLPGATATLDRLDVLLRTELASYGYSSIEEAPRAPKFLSLERIIHFRNCKAEQIVMAQQIIMEVGFIGQYQVMDLKSVAMHRKSG